jgi:hypothetical protein
MNGAGWMWHGVGLFAVLLAAVAVPWAGMQLLGPSLAEGSRGVRNYRGREVPLGLGLVWVFWTVALAVHQVLAQVLGLPHEYTASLWFEIAIAVPLVLGAFTFGLIDDTFGTAGHKGFRGHLSALRRGRLTTGALKLFGIGFLALLGSALPAFGLEGVTPRSIAHYVVAVLVIGLAANTVNLFDLRPGRALKAYSVFVVVSVPAGVWSLVIGSERLAPTSAAFDGLLVLVVALGPVLAVWRQDVGEEGMLGDAGANAFGMLAGLLLVSALPFAGAVAAAAVLMGVNLASEKVSFSAVIERTPWLAALDRWGRPTDTPAP